MKTLLSLRDIHKSFAAVHALKGISLDIREGEVLAVVGENGAGKSTLIKTLCGIISQDKGEIFFEDTKLTDLDPNKSQRLGIKAVQQHFSLIPTMSVAENLFYNDLPDTKFGFINWKTTIEQAQKYLELIGYGTIDANSIVKDLSVADCQRIEVAKAIRGNAKVLILDEPSAVLPEVDVAKLFDILRSLKEKGVAIIYISHHLDEVFEIADRIAVLKDGELVADIQDPKSIDGFGLIKLMVGRDIHDIYPPIGKHKENVVLSVKNLSTNHVKDVSFDLHEGEILGVAGLVGSGRTELCKALFGMDRILKGTIDVGDQTYCPTCPKDAIKNGFGFVTEDRHFDGLILGETVANNVTFVGSKKIVKKGLLSKKLNAAIADKYVDELHIATPSSMQKAYYLSGGNQQKVVIAKWLFIEPKILLLDEATRGIDVGAKREIYNLISELSNSGVSIIMVSSELQEVIQLSNRVLVMREGSVVGEYTHERATEEDIIAKASGL
jgi:ABC-type sugar transport system ATPase subunit